ncbi:MAG: flagellar FliJ family protein [Pirellulaceae bacterium]
MLRRNVAEALQAITILETQIRDKQRAIEDLKVHQTSGLVGRVQVDELLAQGRYQMVFELDIKTLNDQLNQVQAEYQKRQAVLQVADQEVKRIEKLRDHALRVYRDAEQTISQAEMDEVASVRYQMTRNERG